jgi:hypothetical protein
MDEDGRQHLWSLYGWFCALMLCGSCFGVVTWTARIMNLENLFSSDNAFTRGDQVQRYSLASLAQNWAAVFWVTYVTPFLHCIIVTLCQVRD